MLATRQIINTPSRANFKAAFSRLRGESEKTKTKTKKAERCVLWKTSRRALLQRHTPPFSFLCVFLSRSGENRLRNSSQVCVILLLVLLTCYTPLYKVLRKGRYILLCCLRLASPSAAALTDAAETGRTFTRRPLDSDSQPPPPPPPTPPTASTSPTTPCSLWHGEQ